MVTRELNAFLIRTAGVDVVIPLKVELKYNPDTDPLAVEMVIHQSDSTAGINEKGEESAEPIGWYFGRDLLVAAVATKQPTGVGDVRFRAGMNNCLFLCLRNPYAHADFKLPLDEVKEFLDDTADDAQNLDSLHLDLAEFLDEVLGG